jgi:glycosyltransferase involved in cell wall biosynthesis
LRIVGDGPYRKELEKMANDNVQFTGRLDEKDLITAYEECRAFIFPGEEDFGIAPVEAQAAGRPVIAFAGGGALETVNDGISGVFFNEQTSKSVADAVRRFVATEHVFVPEIVRRNAIRFDKEVFKDNIRKYVVDVYSREKSRG